MLSSARKFAVELSKLQRPSPSYFLTSKIINPNYQNVLRMSTKLVPADRIKNNEENIWVEFNRLVLKYKPINLGQGFPDMAAPECAIKAMQDAMNVRNSPVHQYTRAYGHKRLVNVLAMLYSRLNQRIIDSLTETVITVGAYEALYCTILGLVNPGEEVIIIEPFFDCYEPMVKMADAVPVFIALQPTKSGEVMSSRDWVLDFDELERKFNHKTKAIIINTPNNPLGKVYSREELEKIAALAKKWDVLVIADEVYEWLVYDGLEHVRMATLPGMWERTISIGSAGKTFSVTGWKLGWAYGPPHLISCLQRMHDNMVNCVAVPIQEAVAASFEHEIKSLTSPECYFNKLPADLRAKRDSIVQMLIEAGMDPVIPEGGYFILADYTRLAQKHDYDNGENRAEDHKFCTWMMREKKVTAIPNTAFYSKEHQHLGEKYIRFCFFKEDSTLKAAHEILKTLQD